MINGVLDFYKKTISRSIYFLHSTIEYRNIILNKVTDITECDNYSCVL